MIYFQQVVSLLKLTNIRKAARLEGEIKQRIRTKRTKGNYQRFDEL